MLRQSQGLDADDPTAGYMLQAGARLCKTLGEEFLPYLGTVMPSLLASAAHKPDIEVADEGSGDEGDDEDDDEVRPLCIQAIPGAGQSLSSAALLIACMGNGGACLSGRKSLSQVASALRSGLPQTSGQLLRFGLTSATNNLASLQLIVQGCRASFRINQGTPSWLDRDCCSGSFLVMTEKTTQ